MLEDATEEQITNMPTIMADFGDYLANNNYFSAITYNDEECRIYLARMVKNTRESKGLSIYQLSKLSGVQITNIQRIENGQYSARFDTVMRLLTAMKVSLFVE